MVSSNSIISRSSCCIVDQSLLSSYPVYFISIVVWIFRLSVCIGLLGYHRCLARTLPLRPSPLRLFQPELATMKSLSSRDLANPGESEKANKATKSGGNASTMQLDATKPSIAKKGPRKRRQLRTQLRRLLPSLLSEPTREYASEDSSEVAATHAATIAADVDAPVSAPVTAPVVVPRPLVVLRLILRPCRRP